VSDTSSSRVAEAHFAEVSDTFAGATDGSVAQRRCL